MTSPRAALFNLYETNDLVEQAYAESEGEVTEATEALEELQALALDDALKRFAGFVRYCELSRANVEAEYERLETVDARICKAQTWAQDQLLALLDGAKKRKATAGTFKITTRIGSERVVIEMGDEPLDLDSLPPELINVTPAQTIPETRKLDKSAAKAHIKAGNEIPRVSIERGPTTVSVN